MKTNKMFVSYNKPQLALGLFVFNLLFLFCFKYYFQIVSCVHAFKQTRVAISSD